LLLLHTHTRTRGYILECRKIKLKDPEEETIIVRSERRIEVQTKGYKKVTNQDESRRSAEEKEALVAEYVGGLAFVSTELISQSEERKLELRFQDEFQFKENMLQHHLRELSLRT
jgi:hypothetical protein